MKTLLLLFLSASFAFAQPPTTIRPGSQLQSAVVNANFGGLYSGRVGRWSGTGAPGNVPFSIIGDLYYDTTTPGKVYGCYRIGCTAVAANNWVVVSGGSAAGSSNDIQVNVSAAFGGARGTIDSSGNAAFPGTVTTGSGCSGCAGSDDMIAGTPAAVPANSFGWGAPATMTTSLRLLPPNAAPTANQIMLFGVPSANVSIFSWGTPTITAGANVSVTGAWPAWTVASSGGSGGTAVAPYSTTVTSQTSVSITAATHGQGTLATPWCFDGSTPRIAVSCAYTRNTSGDLVFTFSPAFTGQIEIGSGGGISTAPFSSAVTAQTSVSITAATHGRGVTPRADCFNNASPAVAASCAYTRNGSGDLAFTFSPAFTGTIEIRY